MRKLGASKQTHRFRRIIKNRKRLAMITHNLEIINKSGLFTFYLHFSCFDIVSLQLTKHNFKVQKLRIEMLKD